MVSPDHFLEIVQVHGCPSLRGSKKPCGFCQPLLSVPVGVPVYHVWECNGEIHPFSVRFFCPKTAPCSARLLCLFEKWWVIV